MNGADNKERVVAGEVRKKVRQLLVRDTLSRSDELPGKWRKRYAELVREYQKSGLCYEHAEASALEDVLCFMAMAGELIVWLPKEKRDVGECS